MLQRLLLSGVLAGLIVGALVTLIHLTMVAPIILEAEVYETKADASSTPMHDHGAAVAEHGHDEEAWTPQDGWERSLYTLAANFAMAVGFALLLAAAFTIRGRSIDLRAGVLWGLAGYLCFSFLPALGLPPELPGSAAADLSARQAWWVGTVAASITGLSIAAFSSSRALKLGGIALLFVPHLIGAPHPTSGEAGAVPPELAAHFVVVTMFMNAAMWAALGAATAYFFERFSAPMRGQIIDINV